MSEDAEQRTDIMTVSVQDALALASFQARMEGFMLGVQVATREAIRLQTEEVRRRSSRPDAFLERSGSGRDTNTCDDSSVGLAGAGSTENPGGVGVNGVGLH